MKTSKPNIEKVWNKQVFEMFRKLYIHFFDEVVGAFDRCLVDGVNGRIIHNDDKDENVYDVTNVYKFASLLIDYMEIFKFGGFNLMAIEVQNEYARENNIDQKQLEDWDIVFGIKSCNR